MSPRSKKLVLLLLRLVVSLAIVTYLVHLLDWTRFFALLETMQIAVALLAPVILLAGFLLAALRWRTLLIGMGIDLGLIAAYWLYLDGIFYGSVLPGVLGGDIVRVTLASKRIGGQVAELTTSVVIERLFGVLALLLIGGAGAHASAHLFAVEIQQRVAWPLQMAALLALAALVVVPVLPRIPAAWFQSSTHKGLRATLSRVGRRVISLSRRRLLAILAVSVALQGIDIVTTCVLARALGLQVPLVVFPFVIPLVYLATVLPISLGGLGVREGVIVYFFVKLGVPTSDAVTLSFLVYFNRIIVALLGWLLRSLCKAKRS